jgi:hypothetical protein
MVLTEARLLPQSRGAATAYCATNSELQFLYKQSQAHFRIRAPSCRRKNREPRDLRNPSHRLCANWSARGQVAGANRKMFLSWIQKDMDLYLLLTFKTRSDFWRWVACFGLLTLEALRPLTRVRTNAAIIASSSCAE